VFGDTFGSFLLTLSDIDREVSLERLICSDRKQEERGTKLEYNKLYWKDSFLKVIGGNHQATQSCANASGQNRFSLRLLTPIHDILAPALTFPYVKSLQGKRPFTFSTSSDKGSVRYPDTREERAF
jgi:hypothetical protein